MRCNTNYWKDYKPGCRVEVQRPYNAFCVSPLLKCYISYLSMCVMLLCSLETPTLLFVWTFHAFVFSIYLSKELLMLLTVLAFITSHSDPTAQK